MPKWNSNDYIQKKRNVDKVKALSDLNDKLLRVIPASHRDARKLAEYQALLKREAWRKNFRANERLALKLAEEFLNK